MKNLFECCVNIHIIANGIQTTVTVVSLINTIHIRVSCINTNCLYERKDDKTDSSDHSPYM